MGLFAWLKAQQAARDAARQVKAVRTAQQHVATELAKWQAEQDELEQELVLAMSGGFGQPVGALPVVLHKGENALLVLSGAGLVEPKQLPGHWQGGYSGVSFRVMRGVSYHVGGSRGTYVPGPNAPTLIASGSATVTDQRVVFQSNQQAREFQFSNLLGYQHDPSAPVTFFQMSNRQKVSGIAYDTPSARAFRFRLSLALARYHGELDTLVAQLRSEIAQHRTQRPAAPGGMPGALTRP